MKISQAGKPNASAIKKYGAVLLPVWLKNGEKNLSFCTLFKFFSGQDKKLIKAILDEKERKAGDCLLVRLNTRPSYVFLAFESALDKKKFALLIRKVVRTLKPEGISSLAIYVDELWGSPEKGVEIVAENADLAHFDFSEEFKAKPKGGWKRIKKIGLFTTHNKSQISVAIREGELIAEGVNFCRTLSNLPPDNLNPEAMAEAARTIAQKTPELKVTVFDEKRLAAEGMNAILAVGKGSANPPRLIIMEYNAVSPVSGNAGGGECPLALIGKGITFDSGGLNIKTENHMADMHMDMSGGAAVIYAMYVIAKMKLPVNVVGMIPAAENMPSGFSYRQGDIIRAYGGKTIEVGNTDAEGRVVLADAIEYAKTKKPAAIITLATLTGAAMVALGERYAGLFVKNNKALQDALETIGNEAGDSLWPLPLPDEAEKDVDGTFADVINVHKSGSRYGGATTGAAFLWQFAKPYPFAHIDMAPRMTTIPEEEYLSRGAAGFGVRLFVEIARRWESIKKISGV